jgi:acyl-CoA dehydrogenase
MACMFTMMNEARLSIGLQGVAIAEAATQQALAYARERRQGRGPGAAPGQASPIIAHMDVRRMLVTMRALTRAARALCYATAVALDRARLAADASERNAAAARAALLTPVAKAFSTDIGSEVASLSIQVHGGMGYIEETGAAQFYRDVRIAQIYEGTNGIQAIDLVTRKLPMAGGAVVAAYVDELRRSVDAVAAANDPAFGQTGARLAEAVESLDQATKWMLATPAAAPEAALASATTYLRLFATAAGGCMLADEALAASRLADDEGADRPGRIAVARFFAENLAVQAPALARMVSDGADAVIAAGAGIGA